MIYVDHKVPQVCKVFSRPVLLSQVGMVFFLVIWGNTTSKGIINIACKCQIRVKLHLFTHRFQGESTYKLLQLKVRKLVYTYIASVDHVPFSDTGSTPDR